MKKRSTKIVATIGPATEDDYILSRAIDGGADVLRFNMKHGQISWHGDVIGRAQKLAEEKKKSLGIMIDLQGPEIRIKTKDEKKVLVEKDEEVNLGVEFIGEDSIIISNSEIIELLETGDRVLIDDGFYGFTVSSKDKNGVKIKADRDSVLKHRKGMNIPARKLNLPSLIEDDLKKLDLATRKEVDYIALSFTRTAKDVSVLRDEMEKRDIKAQIIAKIENKTALENIDEIIETADGIMVARGDLGIETPLEGIAYWQKKIIEKCRLKNTPVIVATQMLQSMTENPIPTRAEATDVANAIFNGTDAVMLSNETAIGKYPLESIKMMTRIIAYNEGEGCAPISNNQFSGPKEMIMKVSVDLIKSCQESSIKSILVFTEDGETVKKLSSKRPGIPIFAITDSEDVIEELSVCYGVQNEYTVFTEKELKNPENILKELVKRGLLEKGERTLLVRDKRWQVPEFSNSLTVVRA